MSDQFRNAMIDADAEKIQREIHAMAESTRRSIGQRFRYLRERTTKEFDELKADLDSGFIRWRTSSKARAAINANMQWHQMALNKRQTLMLNKIQSINTIIKKEQ